MRSSRFLVRRNSQKFDAASGQDVLIEEFQAARKNENIGFSWKTSRLTEREKAGGGGGGVEGGRRGGGGREWSAFPISDPSQ